MNKMIKILIYCACLFMIVSCAAKPISEQQARKIATKFANNFLKDKRFKDKEGKEYLYPIFESKDWHDIKKTERGWILVIEPTAGVFTTVSMDNNGNNVKVERYGFSRL